MRISRFLSARRVWCEEGRQVCIITYGAVVHRAEVAAAALEREGVVSRNYRPALPCSVTTGRRFATTVCKTHRVIVAYEDMMSWGYGAEIAARIARRACSTNWTRRSSAWRPWTRSAHISRNWRTRSCRRRMILRRRCGGCWSTEPRRAASFLIEKEEPAVLRTAMFRVGKAVVLWGLRSRAAGNFSVCLFVLLVRMQLEELEREVFYGLPKLPQRNRGWLEFLL